MSMAILGQTPGAMLLSSSSYQAQQQSKFSFFCLLMLYYKSQSREQYVHIPEPESVYSFFLTYLIIYILIWTIT